MCFYLKETKDCSTFSPADGVWAASQTFNFSKAKDKKQQNVFQCVRIYSRSLPEQKRYPFFYSLLHEAFVIKIRRSLCVDLSLDPGAKLPLMNTADRDPTWCSVDGRERFINRFTSCVIYVRWARRCTLKGSIYTHFYRNIYSRVSNKTRH